MRDIKISNFAVLEGLPRFYCLREKNGKFSKLYDGPPETLLLCNLQVPSFGNVGIFSSKWVYLAFKLAAWIQTGGAEPCIWFDLLYQSRNRVVPLVLHLFGSGLKRSQKVLSRNPCWWVLLMFPTGMRVHTVHSQSWIRIKMDSLSFLEINVDKTVCSPHPVINASDQNRYLSFVNIILHLICSGWHGVRHLEMNDLFWPPKGTTIHSFSASIFFHGVCRSPGIVGEVEFQSECEISRVTRGGRTGLNIVRKFLGQ